MDQIKNHRADLYKLCKKYHVLQLYVFGSIVRGNFNDESDIDFLVYFQNDLPLLGYANNFFGLYYDLEKLFQRKIDLVSGKAMKNPYFIKEVEKTKLLLYEGHNKKILV